MIDLTWANYFVAGVAVYYVALFALSLVRRDRPAPRPDDRRTFVLLIPARDEELVIADTLEALLGLDYGRLLVLVLNDGSSDDTSAIARRFTGDGRVIVIDRGPEIAGRGKSAVLNHGYALVEQMVESHDPRLGDARDVVVGILDADGRLDRDTLARVAPYFDEPEVGAVQIAVRIANAGHNILTRLQDMEFVGFSCFVQVARDHIGSSGLGGNGQFTRLTALRSLGATPWRTHALTEDLDLGLSLVEQGWRMRFCGDAFVAQQGLTRWRPLLRQRVRWTQGHYSCWTHIPALVRARGVGMLTRTDLVLYLLLVSAVLVVAASWLIALLGALGALTVENHFLEVIPAGAARQAVATTLLALPLVLFPIVYQRHSVLPCAWWELPGYGLLFTIYTYGWIVTSAVALARIAGRRTNWVKTPRVTAGGELVEAS